MPAIPKGFLGIYRALRTPLVPVGGNLLRSRPEELISKLANALLDPLGSKEIEAWVVGCPFPEGAQGWNIARAAAHLSSKEAAASLVVSSLSTSGLEALLSGVGRVALSGGAAFIAGIDLGSRVPYGGASPDAGLSYELFQRHAFWPKHLAAHSFAEQAQVTRAELDAYASSRRPGRCPLLFGLPIEQDLAHAPLPEAAGPLNASPPLISETGISPLFTTAHVALSADGAASLLVAREGALPLRPLAYVRGIASAGANGKRAPEALVSACQKVLTRSEVSAQTLDKLWLDDSYAGVALGAARRLGIEPAKLNPFGSSLRCGFAAGAEGLRLTAELALSLSLGEGKLGLAASWSEGGTATAILLEAP
jgi:acetyl-CoA acyltransferase